jgi:peptidoglycan/xylan/chitin deacetylase (PgdA/CDA1 family)
MVGERFHRDSAVERFLVHNGSKPHDFSFVMVVPFVSNKFDVHFVSPIHWILKACALLVIKRDVQFFCRWRAVNFMGRTKSADLLLQGCVIISFLLLGWRGAAASDELAYRIPILVYHRFSEAAGDSMSLTIERFESQLKYLRERDYKIIPLRELVDNRLSGKNSLFERAVVLTADDGHRSVYTHLFGVARKYQLPVTLFIYPSAISRAEYALTWEQLATLKQSGLFEVQSHSYWHPNFLQEKRRLTPTEYDQFVRTQLVQSKEVLESKLGGKVDLLAWPFGIFDNDLMGKATTAGYVAGFTIEGRHATSRDPIMALPRYLITQAVDMRMFAELITGSGNKRSEIHS